MHRSDLGLNGRTSRTRDRETSRETKRVAAGPSHVDMANHVQPALDGTVPEPPAARPRSEDYETWIAAVRPAFEAAAASGRTFTTYEIADKRRLPEPPDPAHQWGRLMTLLREDGFIQPAGWACSPRPTTHASGVRTWRGTRAARQPRAA